MFAVRVALTLALLVFVPGLFEGFEGPKAAVVRIVGLAALAATLARGRGSLPRRWQPLDTAVIAWLGAELVTTAFTSAKLLSLFGEWRQRDGILTSLGLFGLYVAARARAAKPDAMRGTVVVVLAACALEAVYALVQAAGLDPMHWVRTAAVPGAAIVRSFGTLGHPNLLGVVMAGGAALAMGVWIGAMGPDRPCWSAAPLAAAVVLALTAAAAFVTFSRAAWLGLVAGGVVAAVLGARARSAAAPGRRALAVAAAVAALAVVALAFTGIGRLVAARLAESLASGSGSGGSRLEIWKSAIAAWQARPWLGHGPDTFELVFPHFQTARYWRLEWAGLPFHAHSIVLDTLATRGVLGLAAGVAWAAALVIAARRAWNADLAPAARARVGGLVGAMVAIAIAGLFGALGVAGAALLVTLSALLACAAEAPRAPAPRGRTRAVLATLAGAAVAALAARGSATELLASNAADAARAWMTSAPARAVAAAERANALLPNDDRLARMLAECLLWESTTLPDSAAPPVLIRAAVEASRAVALVPQRAENLAILGRAFATREAAGDTSARRAAQNAYDAALRFAPMDALTMQEYADHEALMGRDPHARALLERAAGLYPDRADIRAELDRIRATGAPSR